MDYKEFFENPFKLTFEKFRELLKLNKDNANADTKEHFYQTNQKSGYIFGGVMLIIFLIFLFFTIGLWIWNIVALIQHKKDLKNWVYIICVILTILGTLTTIPLHILSLILVYALKKCAPV